MTSISTHRQPRGSEITIASIGLLGVLVTGFLSNWDKIFHAQNRVEATFSGYRPTDNFETELRHYFDVSGARLALESMQRQLLTSLKTEAISKAPEEADDIAKTMAVFEREAIRLDDVIRELLPVYQKHFTLKELQELNKFYSTQIMQDMVKKIPLISQDAAPIQMKMTNESMERLDARLSDASKPD
jgi:uncharacterized protein DUF2059